MSTVTDNYQRSTHSQASPWWVILSDFAYASMFVFAATPETVVGKPYIGPVPIYFVFFYLGLIATFIEQIVSRRRLPPLVPLALGVWGLLLVHGVLRGNEFRWLVIDASNVMGFVAGAYWIGNRALDRVLYEWHRLAGIVTALLAFALVGLALGFIKPAIESGRIYVYSVFRAAGFLTIVMPILWAAKEFFPFKRVPYWMFSIPFILVFLLIWVAAYFTATRSLLIECVLSALLIIRIAARRARGVAVMGALLAILLGFTLYEMDALPNLISGELGERIKKTFGYKETRLLEVQMMLEQMNGFDYLFGTGLGSRFHSTVVVDGTDLALNPHLVIFTFLQKGGILCFFCVAILPFLTVLLRLFRGDGSERYMGALSGVLMYLVMASLSGGWEFYFMFLYGAMLSLVYQGPQAEGVQCGS